VNLTARTVHVRPGWCTVGARVRVDAPTLLKPILGRVMEIDGFAETVQTDTGLAVAADIEDCRPATR
jgi:hypothetical protein